MTTRFDLTGHRADGTDAVSEEALAAAALAVRRGELVVLPTDTVYGLGADAFDPEAVARLLAAKGRGRQMPPPVLVSAPSTLDALTADLPGWARALIDEFWPGPLTLVCKQQGSLQWDLGDTRGTVAVRMPDHEVALDLLRRTGPMAVSSANRTGLPAATDADQAISMLDGEVTVVLDAGPTTDEVPSTIVDCTGEQARILRHGGVDEARLRRVLRSAGGRLEGDDEAEEPVTPHDEGTEWPDPWEGVPGTGA